MKRLYILGIILVLVLLGTAVVQGQSAPQGWTVFGAAVFQEGFTAQENLYVEGDTNTLQDVSLGTLQTIPKDLVAVTASGQITVTGSLVQLDAAQVVTAGGIAGGEPGDIAILYNAGAYTITVAGAALGPADSMALVYGQTGWVKVATITQTGSAAPTPTPTPTNTAAPATATNTPTTTPTSTPTNTPTSVPTFTPTPTLTPIPQPAAPLSRIVNVPKIEASAGAPELDSNNWTMVWGGEVNKTAFTSLRMVDAIDGLRFRMQQFDQSPSGTLSAPGDRVIVQMGTYSTTLIYNVTNPTSDGWYSHNRGNKGWAGDKLLAWADFPGGRPSAGTTMPFTMTVYDVDNGTPNPLYNPLVITNTVRFGLPNYAGQNYADQTITTTVLSADTALGGNTNCGSDDYTDDASGFYATWGTRATDGVNNWQTELWVPLGTTNQINMAQFQWDPADWPCYARYIGRFDLPTLPGGTEVVSASITFRHFGNPGYGAAYADDGTKDTIMEFWEVSPTWTEETVAWDTAPLPKENLSRMLVPPLPGTCSPTPYWYCNPGIPRTVDVTELTKRAYANGQTAASFLVNTSAGQYHSGKFFWSREGGPQAPVVSIAYRTTGAATPTPTNTATPTATPTNTATPVNTPLANTPTFTPTPTPAPSVLDDFNRAELGTTNWGGDTNATLGYVIQSNELVLNGTRPIYWQPTIFGASQRVTATLTNIGSGVGTISLLLKGSEDRRTALDAQYTPGQGVRFWRGDNGTWTVHSLIAVSFAAGDVFSAEALNNGDVAIYKNGTRVGGYALTAFTGYAGGGRVGIYVQNGASSRLDNFHATNMADPNPAATATPTWTPTNTPTNTPTPTGVPPTNTPTVTPTFTPIPGTATPTPTPVPGGITYYVSTTGNDLNNGTSLGTAWKTFGRAWDSIVAGDTLLVADGTYTPGTTGVIVPDTVSGTAAKPITIRAINDGKAVIDCQNGSGCIPLRIGDNWGPYGNIATDYYIVEGFVLLNGDESNARVKGNNNTLRRLSAYNVATDKNSHNFLIWGQNNLIEDVIAAGTGRYMINIFSGAGWTGSNNTVRRAFTMFRSWDGRNFCGVQWPNGNNIGIYNASNTTVENSIAYGRALTGIFAQANEDTVTTQNNMVIGSIAALSGKNYNNTTWDWGGYGTQPTTRPGPTYNPYGGGTCDTAITQWSDGGHRTGYSLWGQGGLVDNIFRHGISIDNEGLGFSATSPYSSGQPKSGNVVDNNTVRGNGNYVVGWEAGQGRQVYNGLGTAVSIASSNRISPFTTYNGAGPSLNFRYVNRAVTAVPVLPFPMEQRGVAEMGLSIGAVWSMALQRAETGSGTWPVPTGGTYLGAP